MVSGRPTSRESKLVSNLERLDSQACLPFVADLWSARGFETTLADGVVTATRHGQTTTLAPVCGHWWNAISPSSRRLPADTDIDVVVSFGADQRGDALAQRHGARHVDSAALAEILLYALDPQKTETLCTRHLGAPIDSLRPPLRTRTRQRISGVGHRLSRVEATVPRGVAAFLALALVVTGGAVSFEMGGIDDGNAFSDESAAGQPTPTATTETTSSDAPVATAPALRRDPERADIEPVESGDLASVPGVSETGITNHAALADAHEAALSNRSYTLWVDTYQPRDASPNATRVQYDTDISVTEDAYLIVENAETGRDQVRVRTVYYDGRDWYVTEPENGTEQTRRIDSETGTPPVQFEPRDLNVGLVRQYLQTRTTNVSGKIRDENTTYYRVEGAGRPSIGGIEPIQDYQFVAFVDDDGFVSEATVTYVLVSDAGTLPIRFEWTYGNVGSTTVTRPSWVANDTGQNDTGDDNPPAIRL